MIEMWQQYTCDGCGVTEYHHTPNMTKRQVRSDLKKAGWQSFGVLDYCRKCVDNGTADRRESAMSE